MQYEEFADCIAWWNNRTENEQAWRVPAADLLMRDNAGGVVSVNLDVNNPNRAATSASFAGRTDREHPRQRAAHRGNHGEHPQMVKKRP